MKVTRTHFCGEIVHENRDGIDTYYVSDTDGSTALLLDACGNIVCEFGKVVLPDLTSSSPSFSGEGLEGAWLQAGPWDQLMDWDEDLGEV